MADNGDRCGAGCLSQLPSLAGSAGKPDERGQGWLSLGLLPRRFRPMGRQACELRVGPPISRHEFAQRGNVPMMFARPCKKHCTGVLLPAGKKRVSTAVLAIPGSSGTRGSAATPRSAANPCMQRPAARARIVPRERGQRNDSHPRGCFRRSCYMRDAAAATHVMPNRVGGLTKRFGYI